MNKVVSLIVVLMFVCAGCAILSLVVGSFAPDTVVVTATSQNQSQQKESVPTKQPTDAPTTQPTATPFRQRTAPATQKPSSYTSEIEYAEKMGAIASTMSDLMFDMADEAEYGSLLSVMILAETDLPTIRSLNRQLQQLSPPPVFEETHGYFLQAMGSCELSYEYIADGDLENGVDAMLECDRYMNMALDAMP